MSAEDPVARFKETLTNILIENATAQGWLGGALLDSPDLGEAWLRYAPSFYGDAVRNFNGYPEYCLACAGYLGMAVACLWDRDWVRHEKEEYSYFLGKRGFDDMDDRITDGILMERKPAVSAMQALSATAYHFLMKTCPEPGTALAYRLFLVAEEQMYRLGAAIELHLLGYKLEQL